MSARRLCSWSILLPCFTPSLWQTLNPKSRRHDSADNGGVGVAVAADSNGLADGFYIIVGVSTGRPDAEGNSVRRCNQRTIPKDLSDLIDVDLTGDLASQMNLLANSAIWCPTKDFVV